MRLIASALPGTPGVGDIAIDSGDSNKLKYYDGAWKTVSTGGGLTNLTESVTTAAPNATVPVVALTPNNAATDVDLALIAKGAGALTAQIPDNTIPNGDKRGYYATDWQRARTASTQVASAQYSVIGGGELNTATGFFSTIAGGYQNTVSGQAAAIPGGNANVASATNSFAANFNSTAPTFAQSTFGQYNVAIAGNATSWVSGDPLFVIGNGTSAGARSNAMTVLKNGNVGIGTTGPGYKLDVQGGDINASGSVRSAGVALTSDIRYKRDIEPLSKALDKILNIRGVSYNWRTEEFPHKHFNGRHQIGVIAQEVETQFPEVVDTNDDGYKSVNYPALVAPVIESIRTLYNRILGVENHQSTQGREIASVKAENAKLKQENAAIKAYLCAKDPKATICK